jgi:hypothetical protein
MANGIQKSKTKRTRTRPTPKKTINFFLKEYMGHNVSKNKYAGNTYKLTPALEKRLIDLIVKSGLRIEDASLACGISRMTYHNWQRWGKKEADLISEELENAIETLTKEKKLNPNDPEELENLVIQFMKIRKPNKFYNLYMKTQEANAKIQGEELEKIRRAGKGQKWISEKYEEKDKDGKVIKTVSRDKYAQPQWQAAAWFLERKFKDKYAPTSTQNQNIQANMEGKVEHEHTAKLEVTPDRMLGVLNILLGCKAIEKTAEQADQRVVEGEIVE